MQSLKPVYRLSYTVSDEMLWYSACSAISHKVKVHLSSVIKIKAVAIEINLQLYVGFHIHMQSGWLAYCQLPVNSDLIVLQWSVLHILDCYSSCLSMRCSLPTAERIS